jgi:hypothetical protein
MELEAGVLWHSRPASCLCLYLGNGLIFGIVAGGAFWLIFWAVVPFTGRRLFILRSFGIGA